MGACFYLTVDTYGRVTKQIAAEVDNPIRFPGQYYDAESGLHYIGSGIMIRKQAVISIRTQLDCGVEVIITNM